MHDGRDATILSVTTRAVPAGVEVYNLTVAGGRTYFVADATGDAHAAAWVHNCGDAKLSLFMKSISAIGQAGEDAAKIVKNTARFTSYTGRRRFRIPDAVTDKFIIEVKNVARQHFSTQLQDSLYIALATRRKLVLITRADTILTPQLVDLAKAGFVIIRPIL